MGADNATLNRTKTTSAQICLEVDLKEELVQRFSIMLSVTRNICQEAKYEKHGFYCTKCRRKGHNVVVYKVGENN